MKLLADVNVSRLVVARLLSDGFDVTRVSEIMDPRAPDDEIIDAARRLGAVLISHDQDFSAILATTGATHPSPINIRVSYVDANRLAQNIAQVVRATEQDLEAGAIVTLDDAGIRVHALPAI